MQNLLKWISSAAYYVFFMIIKYKLHLNKNQLVKYTVKYFIYVSKLCRSWTSSEFAVGNSRLAINLAQFTASFSLGYSCSYTSTNLCVLCIVFGLL